MGALGEVSPPVPGTTSFSGLHMKQTSHVPVDEPVGIVISGGHAPETAPRFSAYIWAPGPEDELIEEVQAA
jgi:hypothetical protein